MSAACSCPCTGDNFKVARPVHLWFPWISHSDVGWLNSLFWPESKKYGRLESHFFHGWVSIHVHMYINIYIYTSICVYVYVLRWNVCRKSPKVLFTMPPRVLRREEPEIIDHFYPPGSLKAWWKWEVAPRILPFEKGYIVIPYILPWKITIYRWFTYINRRNCR